MNRINDELGLVELDEVAAVLGDAQLTAWRARGQILIESDKIRFKLGRFLIQRRGRFDR